MRVRKTIRFDGACACTGETDYLVLGWNDVRKPIGRCQECDETAVGPLGAAREPREGSHRAARLAADGGIER